MFVRNVQSKWYLFFLLCCHAIAHADAPEGYPFMRFDAALQEAAKTQKIMFVYFGRYGCGYCDKTNKQETIYIKQCL